MAAIRLEFVIDGDVYPELHAALSSIGTAEARGERVRQLASTGLVWEAVRIHGSLPARTSGSSHTADHEHPLAPKGGSSRSRAKNTVRPAERRAAVPSSRNELPVSAPDADAVAAPSRNHRSASAAHDRYRDEARPDVPVLSDVVHLASPAPTAADPAAPNRRPDRAPSGQLIAQAADDRDRRPALPAFADHIVEPADALQEEAVALAPVVPLRHTSASRSRLLRMKEKGLFRNG